MNLKPMNTCEGKKNIASWLEAYTLQGQMREEKRSKTDTKTKNVIDKHIKCIVSLHDIDHVK